MKTRDPIIQSLFDALSKNEPLSENEISDIILLIQDIPQFAEIRRKEIAAYQQIQQQRPNTKIAIPEEISINAQDVNRNTALILAAERGHQGIVNALLAANANPNIQGQHDHTALICAAINGRQGIVNALLAANANPNIQGQGGYTALICAAQKNHQKMAQTLIREAKANLNTQDHQGDTALNWAADKGHKTIVRSLIEAKANPDIQGFAGNTALINATTKGYKEIVHALIVNAKAEPNIQNQQKETALTCAAYHGDREIAYDLIVNAKAQLEIINSHGNTALDTAIIKEKLTTTSLLLSHGATVRNPRGLFEFLLTCDQRDPDVLSSLECLCDQLNARQKAEEKLSADQIEFFNKAKSYFKKLKKLTDIYQKKICKLTDEATEMTLPQELLRLTATYVPSLERIDFFEPAEIDSLLLKLEQEEKAPNLAPLHVPPIPNNQFTHPRGRSVALTIGLGLLLTSITGGIALAVGASILTALMVVTLTVAAMSLFAGTAAICSAVERGDKAEANTHSRNSSTGNVMQQLNIQRHSSTSEIPQSVALLDAPPAVPTIQSAAPALAPVNESSRIIITPANM